jgi:5-hydroxyisourate hydrolase
MPRGWLSVHVLDIVRGRPGARMTIDLDVLEDGAWRRLKTLETDEDGRTEEPLLAEGEGGPGRYQLTFHFAEYFVRHGVTTAEPPYLDTVPLHIQLGAEPHYHVPLAVTPWGYTHFRGS